MHPNGVVAGAVADDRVVGQGGVQGLDRLTVLEITRNLRWRTGPGQIIHMGVFGLVLPGEVKWRLHPRHRPGKAVRRTDDTERRLIDLAQLLRVGEDVDQGLFRLRDIDQGIGGGRHLGHARADQDQQVGVPDTLCQFRVLAEAQITGIGRMGGGKKRATAELGRHRQLEAVGPIGDGGAPFIAPAAAAQNDQRAFGRL